jgi:hypothetical protein
MAEKAVEIIKLKTVYGFFSLNKFSKSFVSLGLRGHLAGRIDKGGGSKTHRKLLKTISFFQFW